MRGRVGEALVEEFRREQEDAQQKLSVAIKHAFAVPELALSAVAAAQRRWWFQSQCVRTDRINEQRWREDAIRQALYDKYLYDLSNANEQQKAAAHRKFKRSFMLKTLHARIQRTALKLSWSAGRAAAVAWDWLGKQKPFKLFDVSWRAVLISVSTVALVGFALVEVFSLQAVQVNTSPGMKEERSPPLKSPAYANMVLPTDRQPIYWEIGSTEKLYKGFDRRSGTLDAIAQVCDA